MGELGWFASLLMGLTTGMATFFAATFFGIVFVLVWNSNHAATGALDYSASYRLVGIPAGAIVGVAALGYLGMLWVRRKTTRR